MKKTILFSLLAIFIGFTSCGEDDIVGDDSDVAASTVLEAQVSDITSADFMTTSKDGKTLYFKVNSPTTCAVTDHGTIAGDITVPGHVKFQNSDLVVNEIGEKAFNKCIGLSDITLPSTIETISGYAFEGCTGLISVTIPNSVTSIGYCAFLKCTGLTSVSIGNSVTSIGKYAFRGCSGLTRAEFANIESLCAIEFTNEYSNPLSYTKHLLINGKEITDLTIPNSVTSIGNYVFQYCTGLSSVSIGDSVTSIGYCAFSGCTGLTSVSIGNSVTSIGDSAFQYCTGLATVTIPDSVVIIYNFAFYHCIYEA